MSGTPYPTRLECQAWEALLDTSMSTVQLVREGVPWSVYRAVVDDLGMTDAGVAGVLHIPARTLARRKGKRLDALESERLIRLMRLVRRATDVLGTREKALHWAESPNGALEGATPISLLDTESGIQMAEDVLGRIEYGVFS